MWRCAWLRGVPLATFLYPDSPRSGKTQASGRKAENLRSDDAPERAVVKDVPKFKDEFEMEAEALLRTRLLDVAHVVVRERVRAGETALSRGALRAWHRAAAGTLGATASGIKGTSFKEGLGAPDAAALAGLLTGLQVESASAAARSVLREWAASTRASRDAARAADLEHRVEWNAAMRRKAVRLLAHGPSAAS